MTYKNTNADESAWSSDISDEAVAAKVEAMGGLADRETARRLLELGATEEAGRLDEVLDETGDEFNPPCDRCGDYAVVRGIVTANSRIYTNRPLCEDCFVPADEVVFPADANRKRILEKHEDSLITAPGDEVLVKEGMTVIRHGPEEESRIRLK
jgi:hypothetical protein